MENKFAINEVNQICPQLKYSEGRMVPVRMFSFILEYESEHLILKQ